MGAAKDQMLYLYGRGGGGYIPTSQRPPLPESVRREVRKRSQGRCECCWMMPAGEIHHRNYSHVYANCDDTPATQLQHLCRACHEKKHRDPFGNFWLDADEMDCFFYGYHKAMEED